jgi:hypothetical protein
MQLAAMTATLTAQLGSNAECDFRTGPALLQTIADGTAAYGDVSRWHPPSRALPDGSAHINRGAAETPQPAALDPAPNPAVDPAGAWWRMHPQNPAQDPPP